MEINERTFGFLLSIIIIGAIFLVIVYILITGSLSDWWQAVQLIFVGIFIFVYRQLMLIIR